MPPPVALAQQNTAVLNTVTTMVCVRVLTDTRKPVRNERVILLLADGSTRQELTDDHGDAEFTGLTAQPFTAAFVVLPDILEQWTEHPELPFKQTMRMPWGDEEVDIPIDPATEALRRLHKDEIDKRQNAAKRREANYRHRDFMKHAALVCPESELTRVIGPTPDDPCRGTIIIDRLSETEKFACFREFIESNNALWSAGPYSYDDARHRWNLRRGCVCNQFANLFMGYWCNHNGAFNPGASGTDFLSQMQNDSDRDRNDAVYSYRGFADVCEPGMEPPAGVTSTVWRDRKRRGMAPAAREPYTYLRIDNAVWSEAQHRFSNAGLQNGLATYNVYSLAWANTATGEPIWDRHGGILIKEPSGALKKLSADGSADNPAEIRYRDYTVANWQHRLHMRIWPIRPLRRGGYAPQEADQQAGDYLTDAELEQRDTQARSQIHPEFRHCVPRFLYWTANAVV